MYIFSGIEEESAIKSINQETEKEVIKFDFDKDTAIECTQSQRRVYSPMLYIKQAP